MRANNSFFNVLLSIVTFFLLYLTHHSTSFISFLINCLLISIVYKCSNLDDDFLSSYHFILISTYILSFHFFQLFYLTEILLYQLKFHKFLYFISFSIFYFTSLILLYFICLFYIILFICFL